MHDNTLLNSNKQTSSLLRVLSLLYLSRVTHYYALHLSFPGGSAGKESACNEGDLGSIHGLGRSPGEGNGYPLQYSGQENSIDCIVHGVTKSWTRLSDLHLLPRFVQYSCMWELDQEGWVPKNWCFQFVVLEKTLESLLSGKKIKPVSPKGNQHWIFMEGLMLKLKLQYFGHVMQRVNSLKKTMMLGKTEGMRRRVDKGWDSWMASLTLDMRLSKLREIGQEG